MLGLVALTTAFMAYKAQKVNASYKFSRILPQTDSTHLRYEAFKETFGEVGNTVVVAVKSKDLFSPKVLNHLQSLTDSLRAIEGVEQVIAITHYYQIVQNDSGKLAIQTVNNFKPYNTLSSKILRKNLMALPFYNRLLINDSANSTLMFVQLDSDRLYNAQIIPLVESIKSSSRIFEGLIGSKIHISGLPYIRMANTQKIKREVYLFIFLALFVTAILLFLFLRSFKATLISMLVVVFGVIWSLGLIAWFNFEITILSSIIPPLVIVIGIPNCIFLINKYHQEFKKHGNQILALQRVIRRIGNATLLTNTTTALGFASFTLTSSVILKEFGLVACINVLVVFLLSIILIPIAYSFLSPPKERHYKHLDRRWVSKMNGVLIHLVTRKRILIYSISGAILMIGLWGMQLMQTTGNLTDDFQKNDPVFIDLKFIESQFNGVVPLEVVVESKIPGGIKKLSTLKKMEAFQRSLDSLSWLSRSIAITDLLKFARQGFYRGDSSFYALPNNQDKEWIFAAMPHGVGYGKMLESLVDSSGSKARIAIQVADIGTTDMRALTELIQKMALKHFETERYSVQITGASVLFLSGTTYLIKNLVLSLLLAIGLISLIMAVLFRSARMVLISLIPNLLPLLLTAGIMGFVGISIKPSTILVFSIAFGISVDDTIHFLAKYRQELQRTKWNIRQAVVETIRETSVSMFYTSVVLFFGFSIFAASEFGGTQSLGILVSITLFLAMFSNLIILPSLLLSLDKLINERSFSKLSIRLSSKESEKDEDESEEAPTFRHPN